MASAGTAKQMAHCFKQTQTKHNPNRPQTNVQRGHERDEIIDLWLRQGEGLDVFVKVRVLETVALVVMIDDIPQRLLRAVMKIGPRHQYVANVRCLEGGNIGLFLGDQKPAKDREVRSNGGTIDASVSGGTLLLNGTGGITNTSVFEATSGGKSVTTGAG